MPTLSTLPIVVPNAHGLYQYMNGVPTRLVGADGEALLWDDILGRWVPGTPPGGTPYDDTALTARVDALETAVDALEAAGAGNFSFYDRRKPRTTDALDIDFTSATAWPSGWNVYNSADFHTSDWNTTTPGGLYLYAPGSDSTFRGRYRAWPSGDGAFLLGISMPVHAENYQLVGLRLSEGTSTATKGIHWRFGYHGGQGGFSVHMEGETGGASSGGSFYPTQTTDVFLQIYRVGTTYSFGYSMDGATWFKTPGYTLNFTVANLAIVMYNATPTPLEAQLHTFKYQPSGALMRMGGLRTVTGA